MKELEDKLKMIAGHDVFMGCTGSGLVRCTAYLVTQIKIHDPEYCDDIERWKERLEKVDNENN